MTKLDADGLERVKAEVAEQFGRLIDAVNASDLNGWSDHYSDEAFISAIADAACYETKSAWVACIAAHFAQREAQKVAIVSIDVTPLGQDSALMTSRENAEMRMRDGATVRADHAFTMLWARQSRAWRIVHSHESWTSID